MRNFTLCFLVLALSYSTLHSQYVTIPDPNLMEALLDHGVDTNGDYFISLEEAEAVDSLSMFNKIEDMTGIEAFTNLRYLDIHLKGLSGYPNYVTFLDVSSNLSLEFLDCGYNLLDTLIIGNNDKLLELNCFANSQLTQLDLSGCPNLQILACGGNPLEELDISNSTQLEIIYLGEILNPITVYVWALPFPPEGLTVYAEETEVQYIDSRPPTVTLLDDHVYLPGHMEFNSNEDGTAYLLDTDTLDTMDEIRTACLDSIELAAGVPESFDLTGMDGSTLWILAADIALNISNAEGFSLFGVGIPNDPDLSWEIYPNPADDRINVRSAVGGSHTIEIANINGKIIFSGISANDPFTIDIKDYNEGIYFLRISDGQTTHTRKFIKR